MYVSHTSQPRPATPAFLDRHELYVPVHKAIRAMMADTLCRVGRLDTDDIPQFAATLAQLDALLMVCTKHIEHEEVFVHPAIHARLPSVAAHAESDHVEHLAAIAVLGTAAQALRAAGQPQRPALALALYRQLALFVADSLRHFDFEETVNAEALWSHYSDPELGAMHDRLLESLSPELMTLILRWAVPAMTPAERAAMLGEMKARMPTAVFGAVVTGVRQHLELDGWMKLAHALDLPQGPGLVAMRSSA